MKLSNLFSKKTFPNATAEVKHILQTKGKIDQKFCNKHDITTRLSGLIFQLKEIHGMDITTELKPLTTRYGEKTHIAIYHYKK